jgi:hypothetical protein
MSGVSLNPNTGATGANIPQADNNFTQATGLDALRQSPSFTFAGAEGLNGIKKEPDQIANTGPETYHNPRNPGILDDIKGIFTRDRMGDEDHDGVPNYLDYMNGGNDKAAHFHRSDGTTIGQNEDGTWSLYDENGTKVAGKFKMKETSDNTGGTVAGDASKNGGGFSISNNGATYTFTPVR